METDPVKPEDLSEYMGEDVQSVNSNDWLFEALSEMIVEKNKHYQMEELASLYEESSEDDPFSFVERKFDEAVHEDTYKVISYAHRNNWIRYTVNGLVEFGVADKKHLD